MHAAQAGQFLTVKGCTPQRFRSSTDREFGKYTFKIEAPCDMEVIRIIHKLPRQGGRLNFASNPLDLVVYQDEKERQIGVIPIPSHFTLDPKFGWRFQPMPAAGEIGEGATFAEGTVFFDSPAKKPNGDYCPGLETRVALMSVAAGIDDGFQATESYCKRLATTGVKSVTFSCGKAGYPLPIHDGKILPEVGQRLEGDLLACVREHDDDSCIYELTPKALRTPDYFHDTPIFIEPNAKIIDIQVDRANVTPTIPTGMVEQLYRYSMAQRNMYREVLDIYHKFKEERGKRLRLTPQFNDLVVRALAERHSENILRKAEETGKIPHKERLDKFHRIKPVDEWQITVTYEYDIIPTIGYKIAGGDGDKGVLVDIIPDEEAPVDARGHRAELVGDDKSTINRMNLGRLYKSYFLYAGDHLVEDFKAAMGFQYDEFKSIDFYLDRLERNAAFQEWWAKLLKFYEIVSPHQHNCVTMILNQQPNYDLQHVAWVFSEKIVIEAQSNNPVCYDEAAEEVEKLVKPLHGPVQYTDLLGRRVTTKDNVRIAPMYIYHLEKIPSNWAAVSSAKRQHFGIPAKLSSFDRYTMPYRNQPTKPMGEAEYRNYAANVGPEATVEVMDRSTNVVSHREVCRSIFSTNTPGNIEMNIDRRKFPKGYGRVQNLIHHILECDGQRLTRKVIGED